MATKTVSSIQRCRFKLLLLLGNTTQTIPLILVLIIHPAYAALETVAPILPAPTSDKTPLPTRMPQYKFIGARTQEYRYAQYIEDWRIKVERIGNLNYPAQARQQKLFGKLQLVVSIRSNGTLESIEVTKSSGQRILDDAAVRIVKLSAPFAPFPDDIRKDTDVLSIVRTWSFTSSDQLETE